MGIDINRFTEEVDEEFKCSICLNVLERPVHGSCGHVFCLSCISVWLESQSRRNLDSRYVQGRTSRSVAGTCPVDRRDLRKEELIEVALPFRVFISRLMIKCDNEKFGCKKVVQLGQLKDHLKSCNFNPDEEIECQNGCKCVLPRRYLVKDSHNCLREMKKIIRRQERIICRLEDTIHDSDQIKKRWSRICAWFAAFLAVILIMFMPITFPISDKTSITV